MNLKEKNRDQMKRYREFLIDKWIYFVYTNKEKMKTG